jgi:2-dehydropantoate 2-reductase
MRIAVFGTGGVGGYFGGRLAQAGEDVIFIARGEHLRALRAHGLRVDSLKGDFVVHPTQATDDAAQAKPCCTPASGGTAWNNEERSAIRWSCKLCV